MMLSASGMLIGPKLTGSKPRVGHCCSGSLRQASRMTIFWRAPFTALNSSATSTPRLTLLLALQSTLISTGASTLPSAPSMPCPA